MKEKKTKGRRMGFLTILTLILAALKLTGRLSWPWVWVLAPLWVTGLLFFLVFAFILIGGRIKKGKW